jgi:hypothetical protein
MKNTTKVYKNVKFVKNYHYDRSTLRKEVQQYINHADERFLRMVHSLAKEYGKTMKRYWVIILGNQLREAICCLN